MIDGASNVDQSIESRESSAQSLLQLAPLSAESNSVLDPFARLVLRLAQDDDPTVRSYAADVIAKQWAGGLRLTEQKAVEMVMMDVGATSLILQAEELSKYYQTKYELLRIFH